MSSGQASVTDITNLKQQYEAAMARPNDSIYTNGERAEVYQVAAQSSINPIHVAEKALEGNPSLRKIIVLERRLRYDELHEVNKLSNFVLRDRARQSKYQGRLVVGEHTLDCHGARKVSRYGKPGTTKGYDKVHFCTPEGKKTFTESVIRILRNEVVGNVVEEEPKWRVVGGRGSARRMEPQVTPSVTTDVC